MYTFIDNYDKYKFTKISVPIVLKKCPSDHKTSEYYYDVLGDKYVQESCFIDECLVNKIVLEREKEKNILNEPKWHVTLIIPEFLIYEKAINLMEKYVYCLAVNCIKDLYYLQNSGFSGFSFDENLADIRYGETVDEIDVQDLTYSAKLINIGFTVKMNSIFDLPTQPIKKTELHSRIERTFLSALKCNDMYARFVLLYYVFEILYSTKEYKQTEISYLKLHKGKSRKNRKSVLFIYLSKVIKLTEYQNVKETKPLKEDILEDIILTRNNLVHRGRSRKVSQLLYKDMIPIIRQVLMLI